MKRFAFLLLAVSACAPSVEVEPDTPIPEAPPVVLGVPVVADPDPDLHPDPRSWVDSVLAALPLEKKVAQLVVGWMGGEYLPVDSEGYEQLRRWVADIGVGGMLVSIGPPLEVAARLNLLQSIADVPLLIAADVERGAGMRFTSGRLLPSGADLGGATSFPPVMAMGAVNDEHLAFEVGRITAVESRAVGVHLAFAPLADVNNNPDNPVINTRSFGEDPDLVARLASGYARGLRAGGVYSVAKHFPGHGDTGTDSHLQLPVLDVTRARLDTVELPPFRSVIAAGVDGIMSAHIALPRITGGNVPATLSREIMTGLLQEELGFRGLVVADQMNMGAIVRTYGPREAAIRALEAGSDVILIPPDVAIAVSAVVDAVRSGRLTEERIDRSVRKLLEMKAGMGLHVDRFVDYDSIPLKLGGRAHVAVANEVAQRSMTLVRDRRDLVPLTRRDGRVLVIAYDDAVNPFAGRTFERNLAESLRTDRVVLDPEPLARDLADVERQARQAGVVIFASFVQTADRKGAVSIPDEVAAMVTRIAGRQPTILVAFGTPYIESALRGVGTYLVAWGPESVAQRAAARALIGTNAITGRLPVSLPPVHAFGEGIRVPARSTGRP